MAFPDFIKALSLGRRTRDIPVQPDVLYLNNGTGVALVQWNDYIQAEQAMRHPIIWRALDMLASSFQMIEWRAVEDENARAADRANKTRMIEAFNEFLQCPSDDLTAEKLRYWMALNWTCYGRIPFKAGFRATEKTIPNGMYPLDARHTHAVFDNRGRVTRYKYGQNTDDNESHPSKMSAREGQAFIGQIWRPGLRGYLTKEDQATPLRAIGLPAQVVKSLLLRTIQTAEGHPNVRYLVTAEGKITPEQQDAIKKHLNSDHGIRGDQSGNIPILKNIAGLQIHTLDNDLSDIHSKMPMDDMTRLIFGALRIPIALAGIGAADAAKFAGNFDSSRASFWEDSVIPCYVSPILGGMTQMLCPPGICIKPVYDRVPAIQQRRVQNMLNVNKIEFLTTNEKRAMFDLDPDDSLPVQTGGGSNQEAGDAQSSIS